MRLGNKVFLSVLLVLISSFSLAFSSKILPWERSASLIYEKGLRCIAVSSDGINLYIGSSNSLYTSINKGKDYKKSLRVPGNDSAVNDIYIYKDSSKHILAATDSGLYESKDSGNNWSRIFFPSDDLEKKCFSVAEYDGKIFLGTAKGLFLKKKGESTWNKINGVIDNQPIYYIREGSRSTPYIYSANSNDVYRINKESNAIEKIFSSGIGREEEFVENEDTEYEFIERKINALAVDEIHNILIISTDSGIFISKDNGNSWDNLPASNINIREITSLLIINTQSSHGNCGEEKGNCIIVLAGTKRGVFLFNGKGWMPFRQGIESANVAYIDKDAENTVYVVTDKGIFSMPIDEMLLFASGMSDDQAVEKAQSIIYDPKNFDGEPSIRQVQQYAIRYAEVHPDKIKKWREDAKKKAWLPKLSIGVDGDKNKTTSDSVYGSYSSGGQYFIAPDDKTFYDNFGWNISLSWDLGDLIWSTDQTTIDSRSKMMVELREDVLDQVTRFYFERRRLQVELANAVIDETNSEFDKKIRIEELTALIDAYTGGQFSKNCGNN